MGGVCVGVVYLWGVCVWMVMVTWPWAKRFNAVEVPGVRGARGVECVVGVCGWVVCLCVFCG